jgi:protein tyrosine/serine phosphatase
VIDEARWVPLDGAVNVRDLGGLPTSDGRATAFGRVLRSDNLQGLTPADVRRLVDGFGLRTVIDLRTGVEVDKEGPGPLDGEPLVVHRHLSLFPEGGRLTDVDADALLPWQREWGGGRPDEHRDNPSVGYYLNYLRDSVVAALRALTEPDGPDGGGSAIVHCAAGKDRTGVVVALALSAAGVPRDAIVADYVATGDRLDAVLERLRASPTYAPDLDGLPADVHRPRAATMERFLALLDERTGGPVGWLAAAGFGSDEVAALRARLID